VSHTGADEESSPLVYYDV